LSELIRRCVEDGTSIKIDCRFGSKTILSACQVPAEWGIRAEHGLDIDACDLHCRFLINYVSGSMIIEDLTGACRAFKMTTLERGDLITIVLQDSSNAKPSRLVQTEVQATTISVDATPSRFIANDDDRPWHDLRDEGRTWVKGHVTEDSQAGKFLLKADLPYPLPKSIFRY
jgi:hypothetical protein